MFEDVKVNLIEFLSGSCLVLRFCSLECNVVFLSVFGIYYSEN